MHLFDDRVAESTTSTGTGALTLAGALTGFKTFNAAFGVTPLLIPVTIEAVDASGNPTGDWEVSLCELTAATTLERRILWRSSTGAFVNFGAGTKRVYVSPISLSARMGNVNHRILWYEADFLLSPIYGGSNVPWSYVALGSASYYNPNGEQNHPGIFGLISSAAAGSGGRIATYLASMVLAGGEYSEIVFRIATLTNTTVRYGFLDTGNSWGLNNAVCIEINSTGDVVGKTADVGNRSTSSVFATVSAATWYRAVVALNYNASVAWYAVYNEAGALLGSTTMTTNIPTNPARKLGNGVVTWSSGTAAQNLIEVDYMCMGILRPLTR